MITTDDGRKIEMVAINAPKIPLIITFPPNIYPNLYPINVAVIKIGPGVI